MSEAPAGANGFPDNAVQAFATLGEFLEQDGWYPQRLESGHAYRMGFAGRNGKLTCYVQVHMRFEQLLFYAVAPFNVPDAQRARVAEFIARANYGLRIGNFELDFSDGEIRYKSSLDFEGVRLNDGLIRNCIYPAVQTLDRYLPGLMRVMYAEVTPETAVLEIENPE